LHGALFVEMGQTIGDRPADTGSPEVGKQCNLARRNVVEGVDDGFCVCKRCFHSSSKGTYGEWAALDCSWGLVEGERSVSKKVF